MRKVEVTVEGLDGPLYCRSLKMSDRLRLRDVVDNDRHLMIPHTLAACVVNVEGPIMTPEEWDDWGGDNTTAAADLFNKCMELVGTAEEAVKK